MQQPNIVFILADDLGARDLSCYGSDFYETPHIDSLRRDGMVFTDAYAACHVCSPTRASIMTGKYPANVGVTNYIPKDKRIHPRRSRLIDAPYIDHLPLCEKSLASTLKENGYETWHVGKWHIGGPDYYPEKHGFDVNIGGCHIGAPYGGGYFSPWTIPNLDNTQVPDGVYLDDFLTDQALDLIRNHGDKPFFLNMWYYLVHQPAEAKQSLIDKYTKKRRQMGLDDAPEFEESGTYPLSPRRKIKRRIIQSDPVYAAMIEILDTNVGRILNTLEEIGQADNTIVIFTSDNGGLSSHETSPTCNAPLKEGKGWMYEGGTREPLLVRWLSDVAAGSVCSEPVTSPDFYPTLLEAVGADLIPGQHQDGESLLPLLKGSDGLDRDALFWHYPHYSNQGDTPAAAIRSGDFKLIEFFEDSHLELYNLRDDIAETENLIDREPETAKELHTKLRTWYDDMNAKFPTVNQEWGNGNELV